MNNEEVLENLRSLADPKYQQFHSKLCPGVNTILGVRVPILRKYAKELSKEIVLEDYLKQANSDYYEEIMLQGMLIGLSKEKPEKILEYLRKFIPKIDNWAVCDVTCAGLKFVKKNKKLVWDFLQEYLKSEKEFEVRFALVMLLDFYIEAEYIEEILVICNQTRQEGYYVKMAVAWLISICYIKFPTQTMLFLQDNQLDDFTYQKALQKIIESYRVTEEEKCLLRKMKRREK